MKKTFIDPLAIVVRLEKQDIICTSGGGCNQGGNFTSEDNLGG